MAKHPPVEAGFEDGSWFLEAIGAKTSTPKTRETLAALESDNAVPDAATAESHPESLTGGSVAEVRSGYLDGDSGTSTSSFDPIPDIPPTPEGLFEPNQTSAQREQDPLTKPRAKRRFRRPAIGLVIFLGVGLAAALLWLPNVLEQQAFTVRQNNYDAALNVRTHLPASQTALDSITNPNSPPSDVAAAISIIATLSNRGAALDDAASEPLPASVPFVTPPSMENLDLFTDQSMFLAADTSQIARRLNRAYVYRTSMPKLLITGELPTAASTNEISVLSVTLASSLADNALLVSDLPNDPAFEMTLALASSTLDEYNQWQDDYLNSLTQQDEDAASDLLVALDLLRSDLADTTRTNLLKFRTELDSHIVVLASSLDNHLENLSR